MESAGWVCCARGDERNGIVRVDTMDVSSVVAFPDDDSVAGAMETATSVVLLAVAEDLAESLAESSESGRETTCDHRVISRRFGKKFHQRTKEQSRVPISCGIVRVVSAIGPALALSSSAW